MGTTKQSIQSLHKNWANSFKNRQKFVCNHFVKEIGTQSVGRFPFNLSSVSLKSRREGRLLSLFSLSVHVVSFIPPSNHSRSCNSSFQFRPWASPLLFFQSSLAKKNPVRSSFSSDCLFSVRLECVLSPPFQPLFSLSVRYAKKEGARVLLF